MDTGFATTAFMAGIGVSFAVAFLFAVFHAAFFVLAKLIDA